MHAAANAVAVASVHDKARALQQRRAEDRLIAGAIEHLATTGEYLSTTDYQARVEAIQQAEDRVAGCGGVVDLLSRLMGRRPSLPEADGPTAASAAAPASRLLFGKKVSANEKLQQALDAVIERREALASRAEAARSSARSWLAASKKREALASLKRAKVLEGQLQAVLSTETALEQQMSALESSELNKEVSDAMSASLKKARKGLKGLTGRVDDAVEGASELSDLSNEVASLLGEGARDTFDDDELEAELLAMTNEVPQPQAEAEAAAQPAVAPSALPSAPKRVVAKAEAEGSVGVGSV